MSVAAKDGLQSDPRRSGGLGARQTGAKAMPQSNSSRRLVLRLVLFTLAGWLLWALGRVEAKPGLDDAVTTADSQSRATTRARAKDTRFSKRRLATTLAFTT